jgi:hypothetical protein
MKVEENGAEFIHEEDGTVIINKGTLMKKWVNENSQDFFLDVILTKENKKTDNETAPCNTIL